MCDCKGKQQKWPADAPEWANYMATDADGRTVMFEDKPAQQDTLLYWGVSTGRRENIGRAVPNWRDTLIERPKPVKQKIDWSKLRINGLNVGISMSNPTSDWVAWNCDEHTRGNPLPDGLMVEWYYWGHKPVFTSLQKTVIGWDDVVSFRLVGIQEGWE